MKTSKNKILVTHLPFQLVGLFILFESGCCAVLFISCTALLSDCDIIFSWMSRPSNESMVKPRMSNKHFLPLPVSRPGFPENFFQKIPASGPEFRDLSRPKRPLVISTAAVNQCYQNSHRRTKFSFFPLLLSDECADLFPGSVGHAAHAPPHATAGADIFTKWRWEERKIKKKDTAEKNTASLLFFSCREISLHILRWRGSSVWVRRLGRKCDGSSWKHCISTLSGLQFGGEKSEEKCIKIFKI